MKTATRTKSSIFYFWIAMFCALTAITFMRMGVLSAYAMNYTENAEFTAWLNGRGELNRMTRSLAMGFFRIDTKFYDKLTRKQVKEFQEKKDKFMRDAVIISGDKYAGYMDKEQVKEKKRMIKYKGIGVHISVPRNIHDERKAHFEEVIMGAVPGLLAVEDFDSKDPLINELIGGIASRIEEKNPEFKKFQEDFKKGLLDESGVEIMKVTVGGPVDKAGLKSKERVEDVKDGWRITRIDGKGSNGLFLEDFIDLILKGKKRSVVLTLAPPLSEKEKETVEVTIKKSVVKGTWLTNEIVDKGFGQIGIIEFNQFSFSMQENKLNIKLFEDALIANKESVGLVIILKDNPGGLLTEADIILDRLLPNGRTEIILDFRGEKIRPISTSAKIKRLWGDKPVVFVTNKHSASASELVAGSMREQLPNLVKIVGTPTFGKGSIQNHYNDFPDGTELSITIGRFKMPISEECFEGKPFQPDVFVEDDKSTPEDEQLEKAIEVLGKLVIAQKLRKAVTEEIFQEKKE